MTATADLERARALFRDQVWTAAADAYRAADRTEALGVEDLRQAGLANHLVGNDDVAMDLWSRAYRTAAEADPGRAAWIAFWLGMLKVQHGDMAVAGGWFARAARIVEEGGIESAVRGYLLVPEALGMLDAGSADKALDLFTEAAEIADRFRDSELATMARLGRGRSLISLGEVRRGVALLDEAMVAVTGGEVGPILTGIVYCASIDAFHEILDIRRAQEWTDALSRWCAAQPDLVPFRGRCLVFRAELMRLHGAWPEALSEATRAHEWLSRPPPEPAVADALYEQAELHRLRGAIEEADGLYREASRLGRRPEPGLALLRLAQGKVGPSLAMIQRAILEAPNATVTGRLHDACVEIALAAGQPDVARSSAEDLERLAAASGSAFLDAAAARADGLVRLAEGDAAGALPPLRMAAAGWQSIAAPYELARVREAIGRALRALGDEDSAEIELEAARETYTTLGAALDARRLDSLAGSTTPPPAGLSPREIEVLGHLAQGATNREIASRLGISERTVDRHVSNIYAKVGVSTRAAATAFAYEHGLV